MGIESLDTPVAERRRTRATSRAKDAIVAEKKKEVVLSRVSLDNLITFKRAMYLGILLRVVLLLYGELLDRTMEVKYSKLPDYLLVYLLEKKMSIYSIS